MEAHEAGTTLIRNTWNQRRALTFEAPRERPGRDSRILCVFFAYFVRVFAYSLRTLVRVRRQRTTVIALLALLEALVASLSEGFF